MKKYPECLKVIPILLAVRKNEIFCQDETGAVNYNFAEINQPVAQYKYFMRATGLFELLENHLISNLYDYLTGVDYHREIYLPEIFANKRWDFVVEAAGKIFAIETARSYKKIAEDAEKISSYEFLRRGKICAKLFWYFKICTISRIWKMENFWSCLNE